MDAGLPVTTSSLSIKLAIPEADLGEATGTFGDQNPFADPVKHGLSRVSMMSNVSLSMPVPGVSSEFSSCIAIRLKRPALIGPNRICPLAHVMRARWPFAIPSH